MKDEYKIVLQFKGKRRFTRNLGEIIQKVKIITKIEKVSEMQQPSCKSKSFDLVL
jgi:hypothetical protein